MSTTGIELGSKVKDPVTGFTGIAVSRIVFLAGCARVGVQAQWKKGEAMPSLEYFDEPILEVQSPPTEKIRRSLSFQGVG